MKSEYLFWLLAIYAVPFLYILIHRRFLKREYNLFLLNPTVIVAAIPFILWDILATGAHHWQFNPQVTLPLKIAGLPLEEYLFFIVIPQNCLLVWVALKRYTKGHSVYKDVWHHSFMKKFL